MCRLVPSIQFFLTAAACHGRQQALASGLRETLILSDISSSYRTRHAMGEITLQHTLRTRSSVLWGLCCVAILTGSISPGASAQDTKARGTGIAVTSMP